MDWCACFVSWCANECGYIESGAIPNFSWCETGVNWFKECDRWLAPGFTPALGDIIFFDWNNNGEPDYVDIIEHIFIRRAFAVCLYRNDSASYRIVD